MADVHYSYQTPFGSITIASNGKEITAVCLGRKSFSSPDKPDNLTNSCATQLLEYFAGKRSAFSIPVLISGSDFQKKVYSSIRDIPYGQTRTYNDIAQIIGKPNSYRSVGSAVRENPLAILIPAHRVIAASGYVNKKDRNALIREAFIELEKRLS